jgi:hypothetical protein
LGCGQSPRCETAIGYQPLVVRYSLFVVRFRLTANSYQLSAIRYARTAASEALGCLGNLSLQDDFLYFAHLSH